MSGPLLRVAGRVRESIVDGPGLRYVIFAQGCPHRCVGCHNPHTWDLDGGTLMDIEDLQTEIIKNPLLRGVTFSGGEPFCQAEVLAALARAVRAQGLDIWIYSGYTWEDLTTRGDPAWDALLHAADVLVDGPYLPERQTTAPFRGSDNQRVIDLPASLQSGQLQLRK